jgi:hypothetical protein
MHLGQLNLTLLRDEAPPIAWLVGLPSLRPRPALAIPPSTIEAEAVEDPSVMSVPGATGWGSFPALTASEGDATMEASSNLLDVSTWCSDLDVDWFSVSQGSSHRGR